MDGELLSRREYYAALRTVRNGDTSDRHLQRDRWYRGVTREACLTALEDRMNSAEKLYAFFMHLEASQSAWCSPMGRLSQDLGFMSRTSGVHRLALDRQSVFLPNGW